VIICEKRSYGGFHAERTLQIIHKWVVSKQKTLFVIFCSQKMIFHEEEGEDFFKLRISNSEADRMINIEVLRMPR
jgi:hypothetical protein